MQKSDSLNLAAGGVSHRVRCRWHRTAARLAVVGTLAISGLLSGTAFAQSRDLAAATLEDLMSIEVTSAGRKEQPLSQTASAIQVLTQEDIRRSGASNLAELLRLVPGLHVATIDSNKWAISARGFNGRFANKMLVLIDGRSVYTPLFSGVYWDIQDTLLEDIERIEIIRGPGAAVWGANAVNGVVNVITKSSIDTQGTLVTLGGGSSERELGAVRHGGRLGRYGAFRIYGQYANRTGFVNYLGDRAGDDWDILRGGTRFDWQLPNRHHFTVEGGWHDGTFGQTLLQFNDPLVGGEQLTTTAKGAHVLGRWTRRSENGSELALQAYFDATQRSDAMVEERRDTIDIDFQHHVTTPTRHDIVWGGGYRSSADRLIGSPAIGFSENETRIGLFSTFVQDEIVLRPERFRLTVGTKVEHNGYTGWELQPNLRWLWTPSPLQSVWVASSRAVRTPSRAEDSVRIALGLFPSPLGLDILPVLLGNPDFVSENLWANELGYRLQPIPQVSVDIAGFYNRYTDVRSVRIDAPSLQLNGGTPYLFLPLVFNNAATGEAYGVETAVNWRVTERWRLITSYTGLSARVDDQATPNAFVLDLTGQLVAAGEDDHPRHIVRVQSRLDLPRGVELDLISQYVDRLAQQQIPGYLRVDARLAWSPGGRSAISLNLQNLTDSQHQEFGSTLGEQPTQVRRSAYAKAVWRF